MISQQIMEKYTDHSQKNVIIIKFSSIEHCFIL